MTHKFTTKRTDRSFGCLRFWLIPLLLGFLVLLIVGGAVTAVLSVIQFRI